MEQETQPETKREKIIMLVGALVAGIALSFFIIMALNEATKKQNSSPVEGEFKIEGTIKIIRQP